MQLADYHLHSHYSFDGHETLDAICAAALRAGLSEIALTDHLDIETTKPWEFDIAGQHRAFREAQATYAGKLRLVRGTELGQPLKQPTEAKRFVEAFQGDFIIGSIHNLYGDMDVGYSDFKHVDPAALYKDYVQALYDLALQGDFDVLGHLTYPLRYLSNQTGETLPLAPYREMFEKLFRVLVEKGRGIEVNTSGLRQRMKQTMPPLALIRLFRACGGEIITLGSDAHVAADVGCGIAQGAALLKEAGFKHYAVYSGRKPSFEPLF